MAKREWLCLALVFFCGLLGAEEEKTKEQKEAEDYCRRAKAALRENNERRAYVLTEEALKADPKCFQAHTIRGVIALKKGEIKKALEEFRHEEEANLGFIENPPRKDAAYWKNHLAWFYAEHQIPGKVEDAFRLSKEALVANPDEPDYLDTLAELHFWRKELDEALAVIGRALSCKKDHGNPIGRGKIKYLEGQRDKFLAAQKADNEEMKRREESAEIGKQNPVSAAERGEVLLRGGERRAALATMLEAFERHKAVRASMESLVRDDLLGEDMKEAGEIALLRPERMLRRFFRPRNKILLLSESTFQEYRPSNLTLHVKDLSKAPRTLSLLRAAMTGDLIVLETWFDLDVFRKSEQADKATEYRFVLTRKKQEKDNLPDIFPYRLITIRWTEGALFFSEMELYPVAGEKRTERYFDIREDKGLGPNDFKLELPAEAKQAREEVVEKE